MIKFANHTALQGLNCEQLAELALMGLRYRALGASRIDFSNPSRLDVYWTGRRMIEKEVKAAVRVGNAGRTAASLRQSGVASGYICALFNVGLIDNEFYMAEYQKLLSIPN